MYPVPVEQQITPALLSDIELSRYLGVSLSCIRKWRIRGSGPPWIKLGVLVRYKVADVDLWLDARPKGGDTSHEPMAKLAQIGQTAA